jgi:hypothetical protein
MLSEPKAIKSKPRAPVTLFTVPGRRKLAALIEEAGTHAQYTNTYANQTVRYTRNKRRNTCRQGCELKETP